VNPYGFVASINYLSSDAKDIVFFPRPSEKKKESICDLILAINDCLLPSLIVCAQSSVIRSDV